ncbi:MAG TPA: UDP-2,3-diacylglucosamine diphosphatase LpxI [Xanthobacteraceae bacterium]|nr:UDP-2,3-diacylglucosamine diphosphatase LpxI [Xanthobacteraceae bacterium]
MNAQLPTTPDTTPLAIICGAGSLPFAVADAAVRGGRRVVLFALKGAADAERMTGYPHHWVRIGQFGSIRRIARTEGCRDVVFIGSLIRPTIRQLWPDFTTLFLVPRLIRLLRGGDNRLLLGVTEIFEENGFRLIGADQVAPEIRMPRGALGRRAPIERDWADIKCGLALLHATGPFDVGQAVVVADNRILAMEAAEGTDEMLAHLAEMRRNGRVRSPVGVGVLVKAPKPGQDRRVDLPAIGPATIEGVANAGLAGIAVVAGSAIVAEAERMAAVADSAKIFVIGIDADGTRDA